MLHTNGQIIINLLYKPISKMNHVLTNPEHGETHPSPRPRFASTLYKYLSIPTMRMQWRPYTNASRCIDGNWRTNQIIVKVFLSYVPFPAVKVLRFSPFMNSPSKWQHIPDLSAILPTEYICLQWPIKLLILLISVFCNAFPKLTVVNDFRSPKTVSKFS